MWSHARSDLNVFQVKHLMAFSPVRNKQTKQTKETQVNYNLLLSVSHGAQPQ